MVSAERKRMVKTMAIQNGNSFDFYLKAVEPRWFVGRCFSEAAKAGGIGKAGRFSVRSPLEG